MRSVVRHRLYLSARALTVLLAIAVAGAYTVARVHDYFVTRQDFACYAALWKERAPHGEAIPEDQIRTFGAKCNVSFSEETREAVPPGFLLEQSSRAWLDRDSVASLMWRDALVLLAALAPLLSLTGTNAWLKWLTAPDHEAQGPGASGTAG